MVRMSQQTSEPQSPEPGGSSDESEAVAAVGELVASGLPRRQAADVVARLTRVSRNTLYAESLKSR